MIISNFISVNLLEEVYNGLFSRIIWLEAELHIVKEVGNLVKMSSDYLFQDLRDDLLGIYKHTI
jgi:hypothetical protein